jgi:hypothetical protein
VVSRFKAEGLSIPYPHQVAVESRPFQPPKALAAQMAQDGAGKGEDRSFAPRDRPSSEGRA